MLHVAHVHACTHVSGQSQYKLHNDVHTSKNPGSCALAGICTERDSGLAAKDSLMATCVSAVACAYALTSLPFAALDVSRLLYMFKRGP